MIIQDEVRYDEDLGEYVPVVEDKPTPSMALVLDTIHDLIVHVATPVYEAEVVLREKKLGRKFTHKECIDLSESIFKYYKNLVTESVIKQMNKTHACNNGR